MARLETRVAVLETELRHAEKEKQNAHLANQALLQLLVRQSNNANIAHPQCPPSTSIAERKHIQELKQECRRLRMQCSRLRRPMINVKSSQTKDVKELHKNATDHTAHYAKEATPTVSSSETIVAPVSALVKDKDDFDVEIKQEDFVEISSSSKQEYDDLDDMDDADTYAPWKFTRREDDSTSKPQFVERFTSMQTESKVEDIANETALITQEDSPKLKKLDLSVTTQAGVSNEARALRTVKEVEAAASPHEKPQILDTTSRSPIPMRKPGYYSYEDRDARATQVTSLDYDDDAVDSGVDTGTVTMKIKGGHPAGATQVSTPKGRHIPAGIIELAEALLSVSEPLASSPPQAKCSDNILGADDATLLRSSLERDDSASASSDLQQQLNFQRSATPSPPPHLPTPSSIAPTSTIPIAPRAMALHESKYSPTAATPVLDSMLSSNPSLIPHHHPSPPPFGFTFTPPTKLVKNVRPSNGEAGLNPRGRKMVKYDDLYDTLHEAGKCENTTTGVTPSIESKRTHEIEEGEIIEK